MALRIEYMILLFLVVVLSSLFLLRPNSVHVVESNGTTELMFQQFTLMELDEQGVANQLSASLAVKDKSYFKLKDVNVSYQKSQHLLAKNARYEDKFLYLKDQVRIQRDDGLSFETEDLVYALSKGEIHTEKSFSIEMNQSRIGGEKLHYNLKSRRVFADKIEATIIFE